VSACALQFYAPILFDSLASGSLGGLLNTVIINIVNVLSTCIAIMLVDRLGHRVLLLAASAWMFVTQVIVAITLAIEFKKYGAALPSAPSIGVLVVICVYICGHANGWGPIGWLYPTEIQPLETRAAGAGINTAQNMLFTFVIGQSFTTMLCSMQYGVFLFFAGWLVIMGLFTYFLFPRPVAFLWRLSTQFSRTTLCGLAGTRRSVKCTPWSSLTPSSPASRRPSFEARPWQFICTICNSNTWWIIFGSTWFWKADFESRASEQ